MFWFRYKVLWCCLLVILSSTYTWGKSYEITKVGITAQLREDGSMAVLEHRTFSFNGSFHYAYQKLPKGNGVSFHDFRVSEDGKAYTQGASETIDTYRLTESDVEIEVRWFFEAEDEKRTFTVQYVVDGAVNQYGDAAVLYQKFIGTDWDRVQQNVTLAVKPPSTTDSVRGWLHGPLWAELQVQGDGNLVALCEQLPGNTFLEIRAMYPRSLFPAAPQKHGNVAEAILREEVQWAEQANERRDAAKTKIAQKKEREEMGLWIVPLISLTGLLFIAWAYWRYGRRKTSANRNVLADDSFPEGTPPAFVDYLLHHRSITAAALVATIFDLAHRGYLKLEEKPEQGRSFWSKLSGRSDRYTLILNRSFWNQNQGELIHYENDLLRFLFQEISMGEDELNLKTLAKRTSKFQKFFSRWQRTVKDEVHKRAWYDQQSLKGVMVGILAAGIMFVSGILSLIFFGVIGMLALAAAGIMFGIAAAIAKPTPEGKQEKARWKALKQWLKHPMHQDEGHQEKITRSLVYSPVLGLSTKQVKEVAGLIPAHEAATWLPWYVATMGAHGSGGPDGFAGAFSAMAATAASAASSGTGTSGGASGGGGGGAGGGGGGAG